MLGNLGDRHSANVASRSQAEVALVEITQMLLDFGGKNALAAKL